MVIHEPQVLGRAAHLWTRTMLRPADVDVSRVYDGFTFSAISWLEGLGFCGFGVAKDCLDGGRRIALDGELPVNPHGVQLSEGRAHGFGFRYEEGLRVYTPGPTSSPPAGGSGVQLVDLGFPTIR